MDDIVAALVTAGVDEQTKKDVIAIGWSLKADIIHV
jgi:hypothetical protein